VKKLISIGVALALLTMVVMPGAVAAQPIEPTTFAKIPFAIIGSGIQLVGDMLDILGTELGLPEWLDSALTEPIAQWAAGPLAWSVDMVGWGVTLLGSIVEGVNPMIEDMLPEGLDLPGLINTIACALFQGYDAISGNFTDPCAA
jgi:hypothetical protein